MATYTLQQQINELNGKLQKVNKLAVETRDIVNVNNIHKNEKKTIKSMRNTTGLNNADWYYVISVVFGNNNDKVFNKDYMLQGLNCPGSQLTVLLHNTKLIKINEIIPIKNIGKYVNLRVSGLKTYSDSIVRVWTCQKFSDKNSWIPIRKAWNSITNVTYWMNILFRKTNKKQWVIQTYKYNGGKSFDETKIPIFIISTKPMKVMSESNAQFMIQCKSNEYLNPNNYINTTISETPILPHSSPNFYQATHSSNYRDTRQRGSQGGRRKRTHSQGTVPSWFDR
eukprot:253835_1